MPAPPRPHLGTDLGPGPNTQVVDAAVVGAGVVGLAAAWELHRRGLSVALVDPAPGAGASRAAAGMLAPVSEVQYQQESLYPLMAASSAEYPGFIAGVEQSAGLSLGYRSTETLVCGVDPTDRQALVDLRQLQLRHGVEVEPLTTRAARALEPSLSPRLSAAFRIPADHQVDPRRMVRGLLAALGGQDEPEPRPADGAGHGPVRFLRDRASALRRDRHGAVTGVILAGGTQVVAAETVLATGMGLDELDGLPATCRLPLRPVYGDILRSRLPPGSPPLIERTVRGLVQGVPVYLVPRADGSIVIGATSREDGLGGVSAGGVFRLLRDAQALVPGVAELELTEAMARARPGTPDDLPCLGRVRATGGGQVPGLVVSTGYFRHGVLLAPLAARLTAQLVTGEAGMDPAADATHLAATDPHRFDPHRFDPSVLDRHTVPAHMTAPQNDTSAPQNRRT